MQLYTTNQASQILNISLQGVHYRIKNGTLKSVKQNGKTYVYVDPVAVAQENEEKLNSKKKSKKKQQSQANLANDAVQYIPNMQVPASQNETNKEKDNLGEILDRIIHTKDEQIQILKKSIKGIKEQYSIEIARLQNNNEKEIQRLTQNQEKIIEVFSSEIKLLQQAFQEMKNVYLIGIEKKNQNNTNSEDEKTDNKTDDTVKDDIKEKKESKKPKNKDKDKKNKSQKEENRTKNKKDKSKLEAIPHKKVEQEEIDKADKTENADIIIETLKEMTRPKTIDIKEFYEIMKRHYKSDADIKELIMQRVMLGDERFEYDKDKKALIIYDKNFSDLY